MKHLASYLKKNIEAIMQYNASMLSTIILVSIIAMFVPILISPWSESKTRLIPLYLLSIVFFIVLFLVFKIKPLNRHPVIGIYLVLLGAFLFAIFLSVVNTPDQRATIILGLFCIFPMCIIDKPYRIKFFSVFFYLLHTALAFGLKGPVLGIDDAVNSLSFLILGNVVGDRLIQTRIESFESRRLLTLEKETDYLTGLKNRRKLYQGISEFEKDDGNRPSGVVMMDIDNFKVYNDEFGHAAGDQLLNQVGKVLLLFEEMFDVQFFRYGGEEFVGFAWGYDLTELEDISEALKTTISEVEGAVDKVSVSIGIVDCKVEKQGNYEKYIALADKALYRAKAEGKNRVVSYEESQDADNF